MIGDRGRNPGRRDGGDEATPLHDREGIDLVAFACGEGAADDRESVRAEIADDVELAADFGEVLDVLATARELDDLVSGDAFGGTSAAGPNAAGTSAASKSGGGTSPWADPRRGAAVAAAARRRLQIRGPELVGRAAWSERISVGLRVAAVALVWFGISWAVFGEGLGVLIGDEGSSSRGETGRWSAGSPVAGGASGAGSSGEGAERELREMLRPERLPVQDERFVAEYQALESLPVAFDGAIESPVGAASSVFHGWVRAENLLARLRRESMVRFSEEERARVRVATGLADLDDRCAALADEVAASLERSLAAERPELEDVIYGVRGLLAAGSTRHLGPHRDVVRRGADVLTDAVSAGLPAFEVRADGSVAFEVGPRGRSAAAADDVASALAALAELAVVDGEEVGSFVAVHADRMARSILRNSEDGGRPDLLHWSAGSASLADVGRVLRLAPAFGAHAGLSFRARMMVAAHLGERIERAAGSERPELLAAQLYGFGDLVDRDPAEHALSVWRLRHLTADYVAVHQFAWSRYPVRSGWAGLQTQLRLLAGLETPETCEQAGALLLTLCTNIAAPGILDVVGASHRG